MIKKTVSGLYNIYTADIDAGVWNLTHESDFEVDLHDAITTTVSLLVAGGLKVVNKINFIEIHENDVPKFYINAINQGINWDGQKIIKAYNA